MYSRMSQVKVRYLEAKTFCWFRSQHSQNCGASIRNVGQEIFYDISLQRRMCLNSKFGNWAQNADVYVNLQNQLGLSGLWAADSARSPLRSRSRDLLLPLHRIFSSSAPAHPIFGPIFRFRSRCAHMLCNGPWCLCENLLLLTYLLTYSTMRRIANRR